MRYDFNLGVESILEFSCCKSKFIYRFILYTIPFLV